MARKYTRKTGQRQQSERELTIRADFHDPRVTVVSTGIRLPAAVTMFSRREARVPVAMARMTSSTIRRSSTGRRSVMFIAVNASAVYARRRTA